MNILITGAAGFIGSHLAEKLLAEGHRIVGLDSFDNFYSPQIKKNNLAIANQNPHYTFIQGDVLDAKTLEKIFRKNHFDWVIHLAAKVGVRSSLDKPLEYANTNINGTLNVLEQARKTEVKNFILASSSSVYGATSQIPFTENDICQEQLSPYGVSKKIAELYCYVFHKVYQINIACLRFFTVYGPRQRPDMAIRQFTKLIETHQTLSLYGSGQSQRDYTYIDDIVKGIMNTIKYHQGFEIYNLGNSQTISLSALVSLLEKSLGKKAKIKKLPMQAGDLPRTWADISKAQKLLHYQPKTDIKEGIKKFIQWYRKAKSMPRTKAKLLVRGEKRKT